MKNELISRNAAIEAVETIGFDFSDSDLSAVELEEVCEAIGEVRQEWLQRIKRLPSVQQEPTAGDCWGCNCPKMNKEPKITFETLQSACKYRRVYSIKGRERKYVDCFYDDEVNECKNSNCPLMNQRDTEEL